MAQRQSKNREYYFRQIDFIFYREKQIRDAVFEKRTTSGSDSGTPMINLFSGTISDPTASKAIKNLSPLKFVTIKDGIIIKYPEQWLEVIDKTYSWCKKQNNLYYEVARRRYNNEDYRKTCIDLHISEASQRRFLEKVRIYAALQAVQLRLIFVN